jgi:arylsulfatase A-like enzyme
MKLKEDLENNIRNEFIDGNDELTEKLREFWFGNSPFVGMGGAQFLKDLRDFIRQEKAKERQKFIEILEELKIAENLIREIDLDGLHKDAWELDKVYRNSIQSQSQKIQEIINQLKDEK